MNTWTMLSMTLLAEEPTNTGPDFGKASPVGLLVVVLLLIGTFLLVWSMNRHLRTLPKSFGGEQDDAGPAEAEHTTPDESVEPTRDPGGQQPG